MSLDRTNSYPRSSRNASIHRSCRCSCSFRIMGSAIEPHTLSPMIALATFASAPRGASPRSSHGRISLSRSLFMICKTRESSASLVQPLPSSKDFNNCFDTSDNPDNLSLARGGVVDIRNIEIISGCSFNTSGVISQKNLVIANASSTFDIADLRAATYVAGAKSRNQLL